MAVSALGLPPILVNMLETLVDQNTLSSWNIFSNKQGIVCVNIRFTQLADNAGHVDMVQPVYYRRQTPKQISRNKQRAATHHRTHTNTCTHIEDIQHDRNSSLHHKKRKMDHGSPENIRQCIFQSNHTELVDTPELVIKDEYQVNSCTDSTVPDPIPSPNAFDTPVHVTDHQNADMLDDSISEILPQEAVDDDDSISDILPPPSPHHSRQTYHSSDADASLESLENSHENRTPEVSANAMKPISHPPKITFLPPPPNVSPSSSPSPPQSPTRPHDILSSAGSSVELSELSVVFMRELLRRAISKEAK